MDEYNVYATYNELERADAFCDIIKKHFYIEDGYPAVLAMIHMGSSLMMDLYPEQYQLILDETNRFFKVLEKVIQNRKETEQLCTSKKE